MIPRGFGEEKGETYAGSFPGRQSRDRFCRGFVRSRLTQYGFLAARLCVVFLAVVLVSGCGRHKEELESAQQQIERLNTETKTLTESFASLDKEKARLNEGMKLLSQQNDELQLEVATLKKTKAALDKENERLKKSNEEVDRKLESLNQQKVLLEQEVESLKKNAATAPSLLTEPESAVSRGAAAPGREPPVSDRQQAMTPCDAVLHYMRQSQTIIRSYAGEERSQLLEQLKQQLSPRMADAPASAVQAAEKWVSEMIRVWENPREDSAFILLSQKNTVLEACQKTPEEAGF
jgi:uncharacterized protein (DUF3084 family)